MTEQLRFESIEREADREAFRAAHQYLVFHRDTYLRMAAEIQPDLTRWTDVWDRVAFAILSANTVVDLAHKAFQSIRQYRGCYPISMLPAGIVPDRVRYTNALPTGPRAFDLLRRSRESWNEYRCRIRESVWGLELTKASYAVCLLYPRDADVACLDIWMQRLFTHKVKTAPGLWWYRMIERRIRRDFAKPCGVSVALAQWALWDFARGRTPSPQRFFE